MSIMLDSCSSEGILLSLDSHKSVPAPFLTKTYQLVDDPATDHIVSWGEDDTTFVVWRPPEFARDLLPNYFKHNNFSSFVRQLNTYGFRKIVPDRWEFANEFFRKGVKHLLCEIQRRKTAQPQVAINYQQHHHYIHSQQAAAHSQLGLSYYPYPGRMSVSPPDSDDQFNWSDSPPPPMPTSPVHVQHCSITALAEDNERLRRSNTMLLSELAHMRKLYNDIIYFVQTHVKPVPPSNNAASNAKLLNQQVMGYNISYLSSPRPQNEDIGYNGNCTPQSSVTVLEELSCNENESGRKMKLFGVPLQSKKRLHSEYASSNYREMMMMNNKARFVLDKDDLGLNLMPPFP